MNLKYTDNTSNADFRLVIEEPAFDRKFFTRDREDKLLTIAWNRGEEQKIIIDEIEYTFPANSIIPLMVNQSFRFENPEYITSWLFNREFYCIVDHDKEVSCSGFIFYGPTPIMFISLDEKEQEKIDLLVRIFKDEFDTSDKIQGAMLRMLLVRLIITITRLARQQFTDETVDDDTKFSLYRNFNLLVENHYRKEHEVQFYAGKLNKSPKTLANVFAIYGQKTPLQIIQERINLEARRLYYYTDKSTKEIASELGFEDASHFSRFFKKHFGVSPTDFKKSLEKVA
ncbi:helix-turn-helix domain-containing protein [Flavobacterium sp. NRK1]|uniref:AraC family transcriptional regulator n=1 Tax=Flavobacterium sp. NRK1 TaxID=2954929 RepID=UPI002092E078|nr:helix-turn-helix domain-containing protein [Flavobacterium sp. NRK1]MCO6149156.1 helix-turn-helix domain-containing protein [Flavobacterium sp. NRK1]